MTGPDSDGATANRPAGDGYTEGSWWLTTADPSSPIVPSVGAVPVEEGSQLARLLDEYLTARQHTLSTAHLTGIEQLLAEADYVLGEAQELHDAVVALAHAEVRGEAAPEHWRHVRNEVADVALADTTFASLMPGGVTVELCIAEKTEADRDRSRHARHRQDNAEGLETEMSQAETTTTRPAPVWREARKIKPGWWLRAADGSWNEVRMIMTSNYGRKGFIFADGEEAGWFSPPEQLPTLGIREAKAAGLGEVQSNG